MVKETISFKIGVDLLKEIDDYANKEGVDRSKALRDCINLSLREKKTPKSSLRKIRDIKLIMDKEITIVKQLLEDEQAHAELKITELNKMLSLVAKEMKEVDKRFNLSKKLISENSNIYQVINDICLMDKKEAYDYYLKNLSPKINTDGNINLTYLDFKAFWEANKK